MIAALGCGELWRPIAGHPGYEISSWGRARSPRGLLKASGTVYPSVCLSGGRKNRRSVRIHLLVLEAFVGPRPPGLVALHADDNPRNNLPCNLRWGTESENQHDRVRNGHHHYANRTHCASGHAFTEANTAQRRGGSDGVGRRCKTCLRVRRR